MLRDSVAAAVVVVVVVRTRPRAILLAMITIRKSTHGFPFLRMVSMGLPSAALRAAGAPLQGLYFTSFHLLFHSVDALHQTNLKN